MRAGLGWGASSDPSPKCYHLTASQDQHKGRFQPGPGSQDLILIIWVGPPGKLPLISSAYGSEAHRPQTTPEEILSPRRFSKPSGALRFVLFSLLSCLSNTCLVLPRHTSVPPPSLSRVGLSAPPSARSQENSRARQPEATFSTHPRWRQGLTLSQHNDVQGRC